MRTWACASLPLPRPAQISSVNQRDQINDDTGAMVWSNDKSFHLTVCSGNVWEDQRQPHSVWSGNQSMASVLINFGKCKLWFVSYSYHLKAISAFSHSHPSIKYTHFFTQIILVFAESLPLLIDFWKAVANVERAIIKALEKQYNDILTPLKDSIQKKLNMQVQKLTRRQSMKIYYVPNQVSTLIYVFRCFASIFSHQEFNRCQN